MMPAAQILRIVVLVALAAPLMPDPPAQAAEPAVQQVAAAQEAEDGLAPHAQAGELGPDLGALRVDHQAPAQVADGLGLEAEGQVYPGQVVVELRIEELLLRARPAQLEGPVEAPLHQRQSEPEERAVTRIRPVQVGSQPEGAYA